MKIIDYTKLIDLCREKHVYIQTHNFPDPDAIASAYGLQKLLLHYQITSTICYAGKIDKLSTKKMTEIFQIEMHSYNEIQSSMKEDDYIICVDSQKNGGNITDFIGDEIACIDHHPTYADCDYLYRDIRLVGSCSTLITDYFRKLNIEMDVFTATALFYGLKMDTLQLSRGVHQEDIEAFSYLFYKKDDYLISQIEKNSIEFNDLKAYGAAIENIKLYGKVGFAAIPFSCPDALIAIISDFILQLNEIDLTVIYAYRKDGIKFSIRSENPNIHAGHIIHEVLKDYGNGGGHPSMAGGLIPQGNARCLGKYPDDKIRDLFLEILYNYRDDLQLD